MENRPDSVTGSPKAIPQKTTDSATGTLRSGDVLVSKIAGVVVYREPQKTGKRLATLARSDEVIFMGEERNGMYRITSVNGEGWVDRILMKGP